MDILFPSDYDIIGMWGQGETDGITQVNADAYAVNLSTWFGEWRTNIQTMPIVFNKLSDEQEEECRPVFPEEGGE